MTRWHRHPGALWRRSSDRVLVLPMGWDDLLLLEGTAAAIWMLLEEPLIVAAISEVLISEVDADEAARTAIEAVRKDLARFLEDLASSSAIEPVP